MSNVTISVPGIHCDHCKTSIEGALGQLPGVLKADVNVDERNVTVDYDDGAVSVDQLRGAIVEQGFEVPA